MVDAIKLQIIPRQFENIAYEELRFLINGKDLIDLLQTVEQPFAQEEGSAEIAGAYMGLTRKTAKALLKQFLGEAENDVEILQCTCGTEGCWPFLARIHRENGLIIWQDFRQPFRASWNYAPLGSFRFNFAQYELEFKQL